MRQSAAPMTPLVAGALGSIAGALVKHESGTGDLLLLPKIADLPTFIRELVDIALPEQFPELFPEAEKSSWVHDSPYELKNVLGLKADVQRIRESARKEEETIERQMKQEYEKDGYLHDLITATDRKLVLAVKKALETLGFQKVIDVDAERTAANKGLREDLRIEDCLPEVVVDVKGIAGLPSDEDALAADKYVADRMREVGHTEVVSLTVMNHQRRLPPLERQNDNPFRELVLENARHKNLGLLTTWDLFCLVRNFTSNRWRHDDVKALFYSAGWIVPKPAHYAPMGTVTNYLPNRKVVELEIESGLLHVGDTIAFGLALEYSEEAVTSMHVDGVAADVADPGRKVTVLTSLTKAQARSGVPVYRVVSQPEGEA